MSYLLTPILVGLIFWGEALALRGADDFDLTNEEKDKLEKELRAQAREEFRRGNKRVREKKLTRAKEISRRKSRRADHH